MRLFTVFLVAILVLTAAEARPAGGAPASPSTGITASPLPAWQGGDPPPDCRLQVVQLPVSPAEGTVGAGAATTYEVTGFVAYERPYAPYLDPFPLSYAYVAVTLYDEVTSGSSTSLVRVGDVTTTTDYEGTFSASFPQQPATPYLQVIVFLERPGKFQIVKPQGGVVFGTGVIPTSSYGADLDLTQAGVDLVWDCNAYMVVLNTLSWFASMDHPLPETEVLLSSPAGVVDETHIVLPPYASIPEGAAVSILGQQWLLNYSSLGSRLCPDNWGTPWILKDCLSCEADPFDAWTNGFLFWLADTLPPNFVYYLNLSPTAHYFNIESLGSCPSGDGDPANTPACFGAVLRDVNDSEQDASDYLGWGMDLLDVSPPAILEVAALSPADPVSFLRQLQLQLGVSQVEFWRTAINSHVDVDLQPPGVVTNLFSTSHQIGVVSPDATIDLTWAPAPDDYSGVIGYSLRWGESPAMPDTIVDVGRASTSATVGPVSSGLRYVSVRAVDRSGKWSTSYAWVGPFTIDVPEPADVEAYAPSGWAYPTLPRPTADATVHICPAPTSLTGNSTTTYWNFCGRNNGDSTTTKNSVVEGMIDGESIGTSAIPKVASGIIYTGINLGPVHVRGGRHTLEVFHDATEVMSENDETDNRWAHQWVWSPLTLTAGAAVTRPAPPDPTGGHGSIVDGSWVAPNCDGFRFTTSANWNALTVRATGGDDYPARMYSPSSGPAGGFILPLARSERPAGYLQGFVANRAVTGLADYDVGVMNDADGSGTGSFSIEHVASVAQPYGSLSRVKMDEDDVLLIRECSLEAGAATITVVVIPPDQAIHALWFEPTYAKGALVGSGVTPYEADDSGRIRWSATLPVSGSYGLVVYRDPRDGLGSAFLSITVGPAYPDLVPGQPAGWYAPLVPSVNPLSSPAAPALPDTLYGDLPATYMNLGIANSGLVNAPQSEETVFLDGVDLATLFTGVVLSQATNPAYGLESLTIPGGRHTLSVRVDGGEEVTETDETNNTWAEQFVWGPRQLTAGSPLALPAPPPVYGGWEQAQDPLGFRMNSHGFRMPASAGRYSGLAAAGNDTSLVTLRFHQPASGARSGFEDALVESNWGPGRSDFLLVNRDLAGSGALDAGVLRTSGAQGYTIEAADAAPLTFDGDATFGPYTLGAGHLIHLYDVNLEAGTLIVELTNVSGAVDWGVSIHPADLPWLAKSDALQSGIAWIGGAGEGEGLAPYIHEAGHYAIAVWKASSADVAVSGSYTLHLRTSSVAAPEVTPRPGSLIGAIRPNPFAARTTIRLEVERAGPVIVNVVDIRGTLVRRLVATDLPAGLREVVWDGRDDQNRPVAAGTYLIHAAAGAAQATSKVVMLR